ncbi:MAG: hypothetical protein WBB28_04820 [Crinalium sp.]
MEKFITQIKVRHYELDTLGHVNNAVYQNYLEQAAIEHMEYLEFSLDRYQRWRLLVSRYTFGVAGDECRLD